MKNLNNVALLTLVALISQTQPTLATYVANYSSWKSLGPRDQGLYAAGLYDGRVSSSTADAEGISVATGLEKCSAALNLNSYLIAEAISKHYENNTSDWAKSPIVAFHKEIVLGACLDFINAERRRVGLEEWKRNE